MSNWFNRYKLVICLILNFFILEHAMAVEVVARHFPSGTHEVFIADHVGVRGHLLKNINSIVEKSIANGNYPGAVVLVGHRGDIIYRGVFGNRRILPNVAPMRFDTIFDIASLTKVFVTTTAIMQLIEQGKLDLDAPVNRYWKSFGVNNADKNKVTIRELLTHTSGFQPELPKIILENLPGKQNYPQAIQAVEQLDLTNKPGTVFVYSDVNFFCLGYLVEIISGESLDHYAKQHIFQPLNLQSTTFLPPSGWQDRIAPTQVFNNELRWGKVHDPGTYSVGGVAGMAGVFSDAQDLGKFLQCILNNGRLPDNNNTQENKYLLGPLTILKMTTPQTPSSLLGIRGLGWDLESNYSNRGVLLPVGSFGHTGYTGTSVWVDPTTQTWIVILTSRTHPQLPESNQLIIDRRAIADIVVGSLIDIESTSLRKISNTSQSELNHGFSKV